MEERKRKEMLELFDEIKRIVSTKAPISFEDGASYGPETYLNIDGFYPGYFDGGKKVVFIGRESREACGCNRMDSDLDFLKGTNINGPGLAYWRRIFYITYGIRHGGIVPFSSLPSANDIKEECLREGSLGFAAINFSKYSNDNTHYATDVNLVSRFVDDVKDEMCDYLLRQLEILEPDIIISANLWESGIRKRDLETVLPSSLFSPRIDELSSPYSYVSEFTLGGRKVLWIDTYHFSSSRLGGDLCGDELDRIAFYEPIMKALSPISYISSIERPLYSTQ